MTGSISVFRALSRLASLFPWPNCFFHCWNVISLTFHQQPTSTEYLCYWPLRSLGDKPQFAAADARPVPHKLHDHELAGARMDERIDS